MGDLCAKCGGMRWPPRGSTESSCSCSSIPPCAGCATLRIEVKHVEHAAQRERERHAKVCDDCPDRGKSSEVVRLQGLLDEEKQRRNAHVCPHCKEHTGDVEPEWKGQRQTCPIHGTEAPCPECLRRAMRGALAEDGFAMARRNCRKCGGELWTDHERESGFCPMCDPVVIAARKRIDDALKCLDENPALHAELATLRAAAFPGDGEWTRKPAPEDGWYVTSWTSDRERRSLLHYWEDMLPPGSTGVRWSVPVPVDKLPPVPEGCHETGTRFMEGNHGK